MSHVRRSQEPWSGRWRRRVLRKCCLLLSSPPTVHVLTLYPLQAPALPSSSAAASATSVMLVETPQSSPCGRQPSGLKPPGSTFPTLPSPYQLLSSARHPNCRSGTLSWALPPISVRLPWASSPIHASGLSLVSDDATFLSPDPGFPQPPDASP